MLISQKPFHSTIMIVFLLMFGASALGSGHCHVLNGCRLDIMPLALASTVNGFRVALVFIIIILMVPKSPFTLTPQFTKPLTRSWTLSIYTVFVIIHKAIRNIPIAQSFRHLVNHIPRIRKNPQSSVLGIKGHKPHLNIYLHVTVIFPPKKTCTNLSYISGVY